MSFDMYNCLQNRHHHQDNEHFRRSQSFLMPLIHPPTTSPIPGPWSALCHYRLVYIFCILYKWESCNVYSFFVCLLALRITLLRSPLLCVSIVCF